MFGTTSARTIQGIVLSSADSTAVAGANCRILSAGKFAGAAATDADGRFVMSTDLSTAFELEVSATGFSSTNILVEKGNKSLDIGEIFLDKGIALSEVTVTADSLTFSHGRTIVYPSVANVKASSSAIDLFMKLPLAGLNAEPVNRTISVDGGSPIILINGVPSSLDDFRALLPKDIEKIEFTRFTPARYANTGATGYISITLKKRNDGGQVYLWGRSALNAVFVDGQFRASYHQGPSQFTLQYVPSWRNYHKVYDRSSQSYIGDDFRVDLESHDRAPFNYNTHNVFLKYDFSPSLKTLFSVKFTMMPGFDHRRVIGETTDTELGSYDNYNTSSGKDLAPSLDLFFRHDFNQKNSIEVQFVGTLSASDYRRANNYFYSDGSQQTFEMNVNSRRRSLISAVSYIHSFSDRTSLSAGYTNTLSHSTNTYLDSDFRPVLTENNSYAYATLGQRVRNIYLNLSTGAKLFWMNNDNARRHFIRNVSSVQATWNIDRRWNLYGYFSYSSGIPSLSSLTDYAQQVTPYLIQNGNASLKGTDNFSYTLGTNYTLQKFQLSANASYNTINNAAVSEVRYLGNGLFLSQTVNARYYRNIRGAANLRLSGIHGFGAALDLILTHYETAGELQTYSLTSFNAALNLWWNKGPFTVSYWRSIPPKILSGNNVFKAENGDALNFQWQTNKHWAVTASWMYMLTKKGTQYPSWDYSLVNPSVSERWIENNGNMVVLSVQYSADFGSIFRTARRSLNNADTDSSLLKM